MTRGVEHNNMNMENDNNEYQQFMELGKMKCVPVKCAG